MYSQLTFIFTYFQTTDNLASAECLSQMANMTGIFNHILKILIQAVVKKTLSSNNVYAQ